MRHQGKITHWKDQQGFGFISPVKGGEQVFVHIKSFANRQRRPELNETVSYELMLDIKGRKLAENVTFVGERVPSAKTSGYSHFPWLVATSFIVSMLGLAIAGQLPFAVPGFYVAASIAVFIAYALDKSAAQKGQWRTAESTLHLFALLGGWPWALLAQRFLRHKSRKLSFQIIFWTMVLINCAVLGGLFSTTGNAMLHSLLGLVVV